MENVASTHDESETCVKDETSNKRDPTGFSLSYDGPTPHPVGDGAPDAVPHAAVPSIYGDGSCCGTATALAREAGATSTQASTPCGASAPTL